MSRPSIPLAPFFLASYPVLAIAAANTEESVGFSELLSCLVVVLTIATAGLLGARTLTRSRDAQSLLSSALMLFLLWYWVFVQAVGSFWSGNYLVLSTALLPVGILFLLGFGLIVVRSKRDLRIVSGYLDVFTGILLIFSVVQLARGWSPSDPRELGLPANWSEVDLKPEDLGQRPDLYFIILDKYTGPSSLRENFDLDLEPFIDSLSSRGFYVPRSSRANYIHTHLSLASMLNWTHLDSIAKEIGVDSRDRAKTYAMIEYNRAFRFLKGLGYEFVFFPTTYSASWRNRFADRQTPEPPQAQISLGLAVLAHSPAPAVIAWICKILGCTTYGRFPFTPESPERMKRKLASLGEIAREPGSKFVFMHLLLPHEPFVFRRDCSHTPPLWAPGGDAAVDSLVKAAYSEQILCLNRLLLGSIDSILANSEVPPIIILQSDHGHGRMVLDAVINETIPFEDLDHEKLVERTDIFAAYHLPNDGNAILYDSITPVNVLPAVLNYYFDAGISPLEDATYWSNPQMPFRLTRLARDRLR